MQKINEIRLAVCPASYYNPGDMGKPYYLVDIDTGEVVQMQHCYSPEEAFEHFTSDVIKVKHRRQKYSDMADVNIKWINEWDVDENYLLNKIKLYENR